MDVTQEIEQRVQWSAPAWAACCALCSTSCVTSTLASVYSIRLNGTTWVRERRSFIAFTPRIFPLSVRASHATTCYALHAIPPNTVLLYISRVAWLIQPTSRRAFEAWRYYMLSRTLRARESKSIDLHF